MRKINEINVRSYSYIYQCICRRYGIVSTYLKTRPVRNDNETVFKTHFAAEESDMRPFKRVLEYSVAVLRG